MGDEDSGAYLVEQGRVSVRIYLEIHRPDVGSHLAEKLVESPGIPAELYALEIVGPDTYPKAVEPCFLVEGRSNGGGFRSPSRISPSGLIDEIGGESPAQKNVLEALASVGRRFPGFGELADAVGEDERIFPGSDRFLEKHIGMVAVIGMSERIGQHLAAYGKAALFGNFQHRALRTCCQEQRRTHTDCKHPFHTVRYLCIFDSCKAS